MNYLFKCTDLLQNQFSENPLVKTIIHGVPSEMDINKANIFPLVNIINTGFAIVENAIDFTFDIAVVSIRDIQNHTQNDKVYGDNLIDNLNQSSAILIKEITKLQLKNLPDNIWLESSSNATPIIYQNTNLLDGYQMTITLSIQNETSVCQ